MQAPPGLSLLKAKTDRFSWAKLVAPAPLPLNPET